ncbi:hypothetical protein ERO13_D06G123150v2 [Gossypium hirsutum]|nr:hypothetical protein ERO13_D06G123150v2 [Gossypium hirsutum]
MTTEEAGIPLPGTKASWCMEVAVWRHAWRAKALRA